MRSRRSALPPVCPACRQGGSGRAPVPRHAVNAQHCLGRLCRRDIEFSSCIQDIGTCLCDDAGLQGCKQHRKRAIGCKQHRTCAMGCKQHRACAMGVTLVDAVHDIYCAFRRSRTSLLRLSEDSDLLCDSGYRVGRSICDGLGLGARLRGGCV